MYIYICIQNKYVCIYSTYISLNICYFNTFDPSRFLSSTVRPPGPDDYHINVRLRFRTLGLLDFQIPNQTLDFPRCWFFSTTKSRSDFLRFLTTRSRSRSPCSFRENDRPPSRKTKCVRKLINLLSVSVTTHFVRRNESDD